MTATEYGWMMIVAGATLFYGCAALAIEYRYGRNKAAAKDKYIESLQSYATEADKVIDLLAARVNELQAKLDKFKRKRGADGRIIGK